LSFLLDKRITKGSPMCCKYIKKGFLLFEILIALVIFSTACLIVAYQRWEIVKQGQEALDKLRALTLARNAMESLCNKKRLSFPNQQIKYKFTIRHRIKPLPIRQTKNLLTLKNFKLVEVFVTWQSPMGMRSVKLISGFNS